MRRWGDKATNMTAGGLLFLALLVPGLVLAILIVAILAAAIIQFTIKV